MTIEQYYKKIGVTNHQEYITKRDQAWAYVKEHYANDLKDLGIETLQDFISWYDSNYKGIPIWMFVSPIPEQVKSKIEQ